MAYQTVSIPLINIRDQFRTYLNHHWLSYLKDRKALHGRYERYKDNKSKGIEKFINDRKRLNYSRLLLLIDDLYSRMNHYDSEYNRTIIYEIPFLNRPEVIQSKYLSKNFRKLFINFCIDAKIIQCDEIYWSLEDDRAGAKSLGYRIHPRLYALDVDWKTNKRLTIPKKIKDYYNGKTKSNKFENYPKLALDIKEMNEGFSLDTSGLNGEHKKHIEAYNTYKSSRNSFTLSGYGNRIYTAESGMFKGLRKYLYHEDHPHIDEYKLVEISNCHVYALSILLLRQRLHLINDQHVNKPLYLRKKHVQDEIDSFNSLVISIKSIKKSVAVNKLGECIGNPERLSKVYRTLSKNYASIQFDEGLAQLFEGKDSQYLLFMLLACTGLAYDVFAEKMGISRKEFKKLWSTGMNLESKYFAVKSNKVVKFLAKYFPDVYEFVLELKNRSYKNYYHQCCKIESNIMINHISQYLHNEGLPFVNLHDGIIIPERAVDDVETKLMFFDDYALQIPFRVENL